jgi:hypothetical protein
MESAAFLVIAIALPGASAADTAWSFLWGAILFGGTMAVFFVLLGLGLRIWARRRNDRDPHHLVEQRDPLRSWVIGSVVLAVVMPLAYLTDGPEQMAFLAGYGLGAYVAGTLLHLLLRGVR